MFQVPGSTENIFIKKSYGITCNGVTKVLYFYSSKQMRKSCKFNFSQQSQGVYSSTLLETPKTLYCSYKKLFLKVDTFSENFITSQAENFEK